MNLLQQMPLDLSRIHPPGPLYKRPNRQAVYVLEIVSGGAKVDHVGG